MGFKVLSVRIQRMRNRQNSGSLMLQYGINGNQKTLVRGTCKSAKEDMDKNAGSNGAFE